MQNEPQLLVEMEELREEIEEITYSIAGFESSGGEIGMGAEEATNKILKMLATALEEQRAEERAKAIGEVEAHYQEMSCTLFDPDYLEGVRASIEIMKGES